jgi:peptide/nickel transport system substrate-binding protein
MIPRRPPRGNLSRARFLPHGLCAALLIACGPAPESVVESEGGRRADTLIFARQRDAKDLDPAVPTDLESGQVMICLYEGLVRFADDSCDIVPALAERWDVSEDGREWTFHLRPGVTFHDGTPLTAEAVIFSLERQLDEDHPAHRLGRMPWAEMTIRPFIDRLEALDDRTVLIVLLEPYSPFLRNLAMSCNAAVSPTAWEEHGEGLSSHPVGTGPYRFVRWTRDDQITVERNPDHWGPPPDLERIHFKSVPDSVVRLTALRRGESHVALALNPNDLEAVEADPDLTLITRPGYSISYLGFDCAKPPMDDPAFRRAIAWAIDREHIVDNVFHGAAVAATQMIPPGMLGHFDDLPGNGYDPDRARRMLEEAGHGGGVRLNLDVYDAPRPYNPVGPEIAPPIQQMLAEVGVDTTIQVHEFGTYLDMLTQGETELTHRGWVTDNGDPDNFYWTHLGTADNNSHFQDEALNDLMLAAARAVDEGRRAELYRAVAERVHELAPMVFLNHGLEIAATRREVSGFRLHPTGVHRLERVNLSSD